MKTPTIPISRMRNDAMNAVTRSLIAPPLE